MPNATVPLPRHTVELLDDVPVSARHPGLQLDKYIRPAERQEYQKQSLQEVCQIRGDGSLLRCVLERRHAYLEALRATTWQCTTAGPLTLHLARASALENAGICLHPVYGFVYFPGTGLKGMARAYAETVWLPTQYRAGSDGRPVDEEQNQKAAEAWQKIESVFGWALHSDDGKTWRPPAAPKHEGQDSAACGNIVFHDAWPQRWPKLHLDIVNNHHTEYYQNEQAPPGDWESPTLVSFLAIGSGETFDFALSERRPDVPDELLSLARQWLIGALVHEGAGAKTAAGYGRFRLVEGEPPALDSPSRATFETTLELVTPGFLAGAQQEAGDCDLRPATLRGLLRWWWRIMHAGFLDLPTLHRLETAVWGDVNTGGAVRIAVQPQGAIQPLRYDYKDRYRPKPDFQREHGLQDPPTRKTTQGLFYASYGMAERGEPRSFLPPGTEWRVRLTARKSYLTDQDAKDGRRPHAVLQPEAVLEQARAAMALLCHFGGVGSKSRKGFGSFADLEPDTGALIADCERSASAFRQACGCDGPFREHWAESPALQLILPPLEITTNWDDCWFALDQVGYAAQSFAQRFAHDPRKAALGLPRRIHGPGDRPIERIQEGASHRPPEPLRGPKGDRHASPVHYHFGRDQQGNLLLRVTAFPAPHLPELSQSREMLSELLEHLRNEMVERCQRYPRVPAADRGRRPRGSTPPTRTRSATEGPRLPRPGDRIECVLLEEKTRKGGWKAKLATSDLSGPIINTADVPGDKEPGDRVTLIFATDQPQFRWPIAADEERSEKKKRRR